MPSSSTGDPDATNPLDVYVIDVENLNHIQRNIMLRLKAVDSALYSDLKPPELTGNSFNYHLRHVIAQKLITKTDDQNYALTPKGRLLLDNVSLGTMRLKLRPTAGMMIVVRSLEHGVLLYRSDRAPLRDFVGLPFGKVRLGDSLDATFRRMLVKRGINSDNLKAIEQLGMANIRYLDAGELVVHRSVVVWAAAYIGPALTSSTGNGRSFWQSDFDGGARLLPEVEALLHWPSGSGSIEVFSSLSKN